MTPGIGDDLSGVLVASLWVSFGQSLAASVFLGTAVAEEVTKFGICDVMISVTNSNANGAYADAVHHIARVAVVPMLIHELPLCDRERAQFVA